LVYESVNSLTARIAKAALDHRSSRLLRRCHSARRQLLQQLRHRPAVPEETSGGCFYAVDRETPDWLRSLSEHLLAFSEEQGTPMMALARSGDLTSEAIFGWNVLSSGAMGSPRQRVRALPEDEPNARAVLRRAVDRQSWLRAESIFEVGVPHNNQLRLNVFSSLRAFSIISRANALRESPSPSALATSSRSGRANRSIASGRARSQPRSRTIAPR
jgi:hypothetical protein